MADAIVNLRQLAPRNLSQRPAQSKRVDKWPTLTGRDTHHLLEQSYNGFRRLAGSALSGGANERPYLGADQRLLL